MSYNVSICRYSCHHVRTAKRRKTTKGTNSTTSTVKYIVNVFNKASNIVMYSINPQMYWLQVYKLQLIDLQNLAKVVNSELIKIGSQ